MLKQGESLRIVRREMEYNDESKELIRTIIAMADEIEVEVVKPLETAGNTRSDITNEESSAKTDICKSEEVAKEDLADLKSDPIVGKYAKMAAMGSPPPAVAMKMKSENVEVSQMNRVLRALDLPLEGVNTPSLGGPQNLSALLAPPHAQAGVGKTPVQTSTSAQPVPKEDLADLKSDPIVGKYAKMAAMGIPPPAVAMKMKSENVEVSQMNRVLRALDLPLEGVSTKLT